jgi:hypothetical protein
MPFMFRHKILSGHQDPLSADMKIVHDRYKDEGRIIIVVPPHDSNGDMVCEVHFDSEGSFESYQNEILDANDIVTTSNIIELEKLTY